MAALLAFLSLACGVVVCLIPVVAPLSDMKTQDLLIGQGVIFMLAAMALVLARRPDEVAPDPRSRDDGGQVADRPASEKAAELADKAEASDATPALVQPPPAIRRPRADEIVQNDHVLGHVEGARSIPGGYHFVRLYVSDAFDESREFITQQMRIVLASRDPVTSGYGYGEGRKLVLHNVTASIVGPIEPS